MNHELARARDDGDIRAVLLTGIGRGFCAGADLSGGGTVDATADAPPDLGAGMDRLFNPMIRAMRALPKPIVAAVNGVAAGGGANLALACDIVLAARSARFDQAFVRISLMPDLGGTWFLPHSVGDARARGARHAGQLGAGRGGRTHGHDLAGAGRCRADGGGHKARAPPGGRPDALLCRDQEGDQCGRHQHARPAARPRARQPARSSAAARISRRASSAFLAKRPAQFTGR